MLRWRVVEKVRLGTVGRRRRHVLMVRRRDGRVVRVMLVWLEKDAERIREWAVEALRSLVVAGGGLAGCMMVVCC